MHQKLISISCYIDNVLDCRVPLQHDVFSSVGMTSFTFEHSGIDEKSAHFRRQIQNVLQKVARVASIFETVFVTI